MSYSEFFTHRDKNTDRRSLHMAAYLLLFYFIFITQRKRKCAHEKIYNGTVVAPR